MSSNVPVLTSIQGQYLFGRNAFVANNEPMIFHCHHYNCFLQSSIENTKEYIDVYPILINSAQEVVFNQMRNFFEGKDLSFREKLNVAATHHKLNGFGTLNFDSITEEGGTVYSNSNHYAEGWVSKFGIRNPNEPGVSFFSTGFVAGVMDAIAGKLGTYSATQTACTSKGDDTCAFEVKYDPNPEAFEASPGEGSFTDGLQLNNNPTSPVNYTGIREALTGLPIQGDASGLIDAFGVLLTRMYSNYYCLISYRFLNALKNEIGDAGTELAEGLLVESGHVCAFNTFGGIMESQEWEGLIEPTLKNREDWVHGIVACLNALGWGHLNITELVPGEKLVLRVDSGYENNMHLEKYGSADRPMALFKTGAVAGIMNLIYHGDITTKPELTEEYYQKTFKTPGKFVGKQTKCRSTGDPYDEFVATRT